METKMDLEKGLISDGEGQKFLKEVDARLIEVYRVYLVLTLLFSIAMIFVIREFGKMSNMTLVQIEKAILDTRCSESTLYYS